MVCLRILPSRLVMQTVLLNVFKVLRILLPIVNPIFLKKWQLNHIVQLGYCRILWKYHFCHHGDNWLKWWPGSTQSSCIFLSLLGACLDIYGNVPFITETQKNGLFIFIFPFHISFKLLGLICINWLINECASICLWVWFLSCLDCVYVTSVRTLLKCDFWLVTLPLAFMFCFCKLSGSGSKLHFQWQYCTEIIIT